MRIQIYTLNLAKFGSSSQISIACSNHLCSWHPLSFDTDYTEISLIGPLMPLASASAWPCTATRACCLRMSTPHEHMATASNHRSWANADFAVCSNDPNEPRFRFAGRNRRRILAQCGHSQHTCSTFPDTSKNWLLPCSSVATAVSLSLGHPHRDLWTDCCASSGNAPYYKTNSWPRFALVVEHLLQNPAIE